VDIPTNVFNGMVNHLMKERSVQPVIPLESIAVKSGASRNVGFDQTVKSIALALGNYLCADFTTTLNESERRSFVFPTSPGDFLFAFELVHVAGESTDESLVNFYFSAQLPAIFTPQCKAKAVNHKPSGFLSDAEIASNFATTDSIFAVNDQPHSSHPLIHSERAVFEDRSDLNGELFLAALAVPQMSSRNERVLRRPTPRASYVARWPAEIDREVKALLGVSKISSCFLQGLWLGVVVHGKNSTKLPFVCQVNNCPNKNLAAKKKLEHLRAFFRFAYESNWMDSKPAAKLKPPVITESPTLPFSKEEMGRILNACNEYPDKRNAIRLRALVLLLRYSGLRFTDATKLSRDRITGDNLLLYTAKTGTPVNCPLPPIVIAALAAIPVDGPYYFWTGKSATKGLAGSIWWRPLHRLFALAKVSNGHAHRFRDTFAVELLLAGVPIDRVSVLLGHRSVRITEKHYAPWVRSRQEQLEADVRRTWDTSIRRRAHLGHTRKRRFVSN